MYIVNEKIPERCLDCHFYTWKDGYCYLLREDVIPVAEASHSRAILCPLINMDTERQSAWVKMSDRYGYYFGCNFCGYDRIEHKYPYCPNCGARMDGVEE